MEKNVHSKEFILDSDMNTTRLPNIIVIGAQKCATTSLHYYLNLHPQIAMSREKELNFFVEELNWHKGVEWYKMQFSSSSQVRGEASPSYTAYPLYEEVPRRMHSVVPDAKLIYILRDPVERILSHYVDKRTVGLELRSIEEAVKENDGHNQYVFRSKYFMQLEQYLAFFSMSQILVMTADELHKNRKASMKKAFHFLNVDDSYSSPRFSFMWHQSKFKRQLPGGGNLVLGSNMKRFQERLPFELRGLFERSIPLLFSPQIKKPVLDAQLRSMIIEYLKDDITLLRKYTGQSFADWSM
jgi:hypothetical protein